MSDVRTVTKQLDKIVFYSDGTILLKELRASYPHLDKPWAGPRNNPNSGEPKYHLQGLAPKTADYKPSIFALRDHINGMLVEAKIGGIAAERKFLRDGDLTGKLEMADHFLVSASEQNPPALRGKTKDPRTGKLVVVTPEEASRELYGGCWVNLLIRPWIQNNQHGKRVNANLLAVQKVRDDEAFGQGRIRDEDIDDSFGEIADTDSGYDQDSLGSEFDL